MQVMECLCKPLLAVLTATILRNATEVAMLDVGAKSLFKIACSTATHTEFQCV